MTSGQRKVHKIIWLLLAIIIPLIMIFSVKDLTDLSSTNNQKFQKINSKEKSLNGFENELIKATVYEKYLEIILKSTLKSASSVVYEMDVEGEKTNIIGQLTSAGLYKFNINKIPKGIIVYDELKKTSITKFLFKWD